MAGSLSTLVGNLTDTPELKFLNNGTAKLTFSIAVNHYWTDADGEKQSKASFFNVVAWRNLAEDAARVLEKGMRVVVSGRLEQRSWEDKETGAKRSAVELVADDIGAAVGALESVERRRMSEGAGQSNRPAAKRAVAKAAEEEPF